MNTENLNTEYEAIICIVNEGFAETVMDAARAEGAMGGTIVGARGTANPQAEKLFNISIETNKEMVIVVVKKEIADNIMKAVYDKAGLSTDGNGICFSLPVEDIRGIK